MDDAPRAAPPSLQPHVVENKLTTLAHRSRAETLCSFGIMAAGNHLRMQPGEPGELVPVCRAVQLVVPPHMLCNLTVDAHVPMDAARGALGAAEANCFVFSLRRLADSQGPRQDVDPCDPGVAQSVLTHAVEDRGGGRVDAVCCHTSTTLLNSGTYAFELAFCGEQTAHIRRFCQPFRAVRVRPPEIVTISSRMLYDSPVPTTQRASRYPRQPACYVDLSPPPAE